MPFAFIPDFQKFLFLALEDPTFGRRGFTSLSPYLMSFIKGSHPAISSTSFVILLTSLPAMVLFNPRLSNLYISEGFSQPS